MPQIEETQAESTPEQEPDGKDSEQAAPQTPETEQTTEAAETADADKAKPKKKKKKRTAKDYAISFFIKIGVTAAVLWGLLTFVIGINVCHTNTAYPSVKDGDLCVTYRLAKPETGKLIVYKHDGEVRFGRVMAIGGETVNIKNDYVSVNDYGIPDNTVYPTPTEGSAVSFPYKVPDNCVFVLNEYRSDLSDSRTFGGIPLEEMQGTVVFTMRMRGI